MKTIGLRLFVLAALLLLVGATAATADDLVPPPWERYVWGTTFAQWEFGTADINPLPDLLFNPNGTPATEIVSPHPWFQEYGGRLGVWELSGLTVNHIPNYPPANPYKDIWVQVTWSSLSEYAEPVVDELMFGVHGELVRRTLLETTGTVSWYHDVYALKIIPNPPKEIIRVQGAIYVDELVIDTICVPEPSSILALAFGGMGLLGLVRRRGA